MTTLDTVTVDVKANTQQFRAELANAQRLAQGFGRSITNALESAVLHGGKLSDMLRSIAQDLSGIALNAALNPLKTLIANTINSGISSVLGAAAGLGGLSLLPFAKGGVVAGPTLFPLGRGGLGLAGESGAEAILPLARGSDGRLGVRLNADRPAVHVTFNVTTPDAASFRRSETQISAMMARVLARGERNL
jgi:phage-related minor tail protein